VKLVLKQNRYFVESSHPDVLQKLLKDPIIQECRLRQSNEADNVLQESRIEKPVGPTIGFGNNKNSQNGAAENNGSGEKQGENEAGENVVPTDIADFYSKIDAEEEEPEKVVSFEIKQEKIEDLQKRCIHLEYPLLAEYDFRNDSRNPDIT